MAVAQSTGVKSADAEMVGVDGLHQLAHQGRDFPGRDLE